MAVTHVGFAKDRALTILGDVGAGVLGVLAIAGVLGLGGGFSRTLDLLNHVTPLYLVASLGLVARAMLIRRARWPLLWLGLAGAASAAFLMVPEWRASSAQSQPLRTPAGLLIRVLTQNVWEQNPHPASTAAAIIGAGADIVVLEEAKTAGREVVPLVAKAYPYHADCTVVSEWCSQAIFSKRPILAWSYHVGSWSPPDWDRVGFVRATIDGGSSGPFEVIGVQLMHPIGVGVSQARQFLGMIAADDRPSTILAGDFNRTPWSFALRGIDRRLSMTRRTRGLATWPRLFPTRNGGFWAPFAFVPLDQVYAGSAWRTLSIKRGPATGSDHYGVLATLVRP
jgi:endonuclease/exonuclease/phosphatase (EEP) superfamily protein YafD